MRIWDIEEGAVLLRLASGDRVDALAISDDGARVAACCASGRAVVWDASPAGRREALTIDGHDLAVLSVVYRRDGRALATASADSTAQIWDSTTGDPVLGLEFDGPIHDVAFDPDGGRIATAGADGVVRVIDALSGQEINAFFGHTAAVTGVSFSRDGATLASVAEDRTERI